MPSVRPLRRLACAALAAFLALGAAGLAQAEKADRDKPMNIEADSMRYDDLKQESVFTGNVVVNKGTIVIRGARIDVRQDPEGYQYGVVTAAPGKLAYYKQKRDGPPGSDEWVEGESDVIEYDSRADNVKFIRNAVMRRLVSGKINDQTTGPLIVYDQSKDTFSVEGAPPAPGSTAAGGGRVRAILTPQPGANAPGQKPAAPAPAPGKGLRPSTTLGGEGGK
ncbi:lipopolysaccharide transport periplasmic protein LptA [Variovorax sp. OV329]|uniref:lipopolysaccharide transport periplasmic protein LptA n=1 Tax=Variovorax sp. OV329 TaxID=1882825 RepID=UPI0008EBEAEB|nr:lipopolysaccharide transport periplasmic protein LptA [Variovorax sp. OV329]SFM82398.1 lipopolysaccharide export system protein LptA [Variovorax sp. OV329]